MAHAANMANAANAANAANVDNATRAHRSGSLVADGTKARRIPLRRLGWPLLVGLLAGCAVGPDFERPAAPDVAGYTAVPLPDRTAAAATALGRAQHFDMGVQEGAQQGAQVDTHWWRNLGSARLDGWITQALLASPTLAAAEATLRQAREVYAAQAGSSLYPRVDAGLGAQRQRLNPNMLGQSGVAREFSLYDAGIGVHYRLDLAGGNQRALEALAARADYRRYELEGARLTLAANIATSAIARARFAGQIAATQTMVDDQDAQLALTRQRLRLGHAAPDDVSALQAQAERTRAELPALRKQLEQSEHLLAVLAGQAPGAARVPDFRLEEFDLPATLPLVLPSALARRRPDIQAAEALLHAANAEYGVAVARLYPQVDLSANLGSQALTAGLLFGAGSAVWNVLGQLTQPLFDPGLPAAKRASLAALDAAAANYQVVVFDALRNVADALRAIDHDAQALVAWAAADAAAHDSLDSIERQYTLGAASYVQLLIARHQAQQNRIQLIAAQAQRLAASAALFQAMGGGVAQPDDAGRRSQPPRPTAKRTPLADPA